MNPQELLSRAVHRMRAAAANLAALLLPQAVRSEHSHWRQHVERLAGEIVEVARSIEQDLQALPRTSEVADLARRCRECHRRAERAATVSPIRASALEEALGQLHEDHRRMVDLRSQIDLLLVAHRSGKPAGRAVCFTHTSKPGRSRFATTGLLTRPSTLG